MKSPARSFARAFLIGVVALIPAVMIARPAASGDSGQAARPPAATGSSGPAPPHVRGEGPRRGRLPARRHRHRHRLARRPRQLPRLGDLQPARQGRPPALHLLRPLGRAGRDEAGPRSRGAARAALHDRHGLPPRSTCPACRAWRRPASPASIPSPRSRLRGASCRSRSPSRPSTRSSRSRPTIPASRPSCCATG